MTEFKVFRKKSSHKYKMDDSLPDSWEGDQNANHNMEDWCKLFKDGESVFECPMQTVANIPGGRYLDTIGEGFFWVEWDVEPRAFKGHIHGIERAYDLEGQLIDDRSIESVPGKDGAPIDYARWIFGHSTLKNKPAPDGELCRHAWSAGCFITTPEKQNELYQTGTSLGFLKGQKIPCTLIEIE